MLSSQRAYATKGGRRVSKEKLILLGRRLHCLALYRPLLKKPVVKELSILLGQAVADAEVSESAYAEFVAALYNHGGNLGECLLRLVLEFETPAVRAELRGELLQPAMAKCVHQELEVFSELSALQSRDMQLLMQDMQSWLPSWETTAYNFNEQYLLRKEQAATRGYGVFAEYHMFTIQQEDLTPVKNPDPQTLAELTGYEREREELLINTKALLKGLPANNILLYGDAGTGKSSTVKAVVNEYRDKGLRLVEVGKNQLYQIPKLMDTLAENPLKFILFIDDLSFPANDEDFTTLKAILEGNVSARPSNIVVYATSNRRHMVQERFSDRQGDDLHLGDTLEEQSSLAARFGLTITFLKPDKDLYIRIVLEAAKELALQTPQEELKQKAEAHAIRHGGRSPRTARQFVEYTKAVEMDKNSATLHK